MDDQGFDFRQPAERRDPKQFEPPPWEQEAFAELERKRREKERAEAEKVGVETVEPPPEEAPAEQPDQVRLEQAEAAAEPDGEPQPKGIDERVMIEMLAGLAAEEPPATRHYYKVAIASGAAAIALGSVLIVWGMAALVGAQRSGSVGWIAGTGLGLFGVFFSGMGVWLVYRALKQQGVL